MILPICDLMDACCPEQLIAAEPDAAMTERIKAMVNEHKKTKKKKLPLSILIAAVVALFTVGTVFAVVYSRMNVRLEEPHTVDFDYEMENSHTDSSSVMTIHYVDVEASLDFEIVGDCYEAYVKPGWLPEEAKPICYENYDGNGYRYIQTNDHFQPGDLPYSINVFWADQMQNTTFLLQGEAEVLVEDTWNGWQRTEIVIRNNPWYALSEVAELDQNNIFLFSAEGNYMIHIFGNLSFDTLEKIAENLDVVVTENPVELTEKEESVWPLFFARG